MKFDHAVCVLTSADNYYRYRLDIDLHIS